MPDRIQRRRTARARLRAALRRYHPATFTLSYWFKPEGGDWCGVSREFHAEANALGEFRMDGPLLPSMPGQLAGLRLERIP